MTTWRPAPYRLERAATTTVALRTSTRPHWRDARQRLEKLGIALEDAVLAEWQPEGRHFMSGVIASRDGRMFTLGVTYDFDESGEGLEKGDGWIDRWRPLAPGEAHLTSAGYPNSWAQAAIIARSIFEGTTIEA